MESGRQCLCMNYDNPVWRDHTLLLFLDLSVDWLWISCKSERLRVTLVAFCHVQAGRSEGAPIVEADFWRSDDCVLTPLCGNHHVDLWLPNPCAKFRVPFGAI